MVEKILKIAASYVGQREISGNKGWNDGNFWAKMRTTGWSSGQSWCAYFTELVWTEAYEGSDLKKSVISLFSASATATYANFSGSKYFKVGKVARPGALAVWRYGVGWRGHIGIVESVKGSTFICIEGNTNNAGEREGVMVMRKTRRTDVKHSGSGLNLIGFIYPNVDNSLS